MLINFVEQPQRGASDLRWGLKFFTFTCWAVDWRVAHNEYINLTLLLHLSISTALHSCSKSIHPSSISAGIFYKYKQFNISGHSSEPLTDCIKHSHFVASMLFRLCSGLQFVHYP